MTASAPEPRRIFVAAMAHLGDFVNALPFLAALRARYPGAHITLEAHALARDLALGTPSVEQVWLRGDVRGVRGRVQRFARMRSGRFDCAYLLDRDHASILMARLAGIPVRYGVLKTRHRALYTAYVEPAPGRHERFDTYTRLLRAAGVEAELGPPRIAQAARAVEQVRARLREAGWDGTAPLVGLALETSLPAKTWPAEGFSEVARAVRSAGALPVLLGDAAARGPAARVAERAGGPLIDLAGLTDVGELVAAIDVCTVLVSGDTGPMHIGAALGTYVVALYGPTQPDVTGPADRSRLSLVVSPDGTMASIAVADVADAALAALRRAREEPDG